MIKNNSGKKQSGQSKDFLLFIKKLKEEGNSIVQR